MKKNAINFYKELGFSDAEALEKANSLEKELTERLDIHDYHDHINIPIPFPYKEKGYIPPTEEGEWYAAFAAMIRLGLKVDMYSDYFWDNQKFHPDPIEFSIWLSQVEKKYQ